MEIESILERIENDTFIWNVDYMGFSQGFTKNGKISYTIDESENGDILITRFTNEKTQQWEFRADTPLLEIETRIKSEKID